MTECCYKDGRRSFLEPGTQTWGKGMDLGRGARVMGRAAPGSEGTHATPASSASFQALPTSLVCSQRTTSGANGDQNWVS